MKKKMNALVEVTTQAIDGTFWLCFMLRPKNRRAWSYLNDLRLQAGERWGRLFDDEHLWRYMGYECGKWEAGPEDWARVMFGEAVVKYLFAGGEDDLDWCTQQAQWLLDSLPRGCVEYHRWCTAAAAGRDIWQERDSFELTGDLSAAVDWTRNHLGGWLISGLPHS